MPGASCSRVAARMGWGKGVAKRAVRGHGKGGSNTGVLRSCIEKQRAAGKNQFAARTACAVAMKRRGGKPYRP